MKTPIEILHEFAGQAMQSIITKGSLFSDPAVAAKRAWDFAEAMMLEGHQRMSGLAQKAATEQTDAIMSDKSPN